MFESTAACFTADGDQAVWDTFGNIFQSYTAQVPMMTSVGNHGKT